MLFSRFQVANLFELKVVNFLKFFLLKPSFLFQKSSWNVLLRCSAYNAFCCMELQQCLIFFLTVKTTFGSKDYFPPRFLQFTIRYLIYTKNSMDNFLSLVSARIWEKINLLLLVDWSPAIFISHPAIGWKLISRSKVKNLSSFVAISMKLCMLFVSNVFYKESNF